MVSTKLAAALTGTSVLVQALNDVNVNDVSFWSLETGKSSNNIDNMSGLRSVFRNLQSDDAVSSYSYDPEPGVPKCLMKCLNLDDEDSLAVCPLVFLEFGGLMSMDAVDGYVMVDDVTEDCSACSSMEVEDYFNMECSSFEGYDCYGEVSNFMSLLDDTCDEEWNCAKYDYDNFVCSGGNGYSMIYSMDYSVPFLSLGFSMEYSVEYSMGYEDPGSIGYADPDPPGKTSSPTMSGTISPTVYTTPMPTPSCDSEAPVVEMVQFNSLGTEVHVTFDKATNQADQTDVFACDELFDFEGASDATCYFTSKLSVTIGYEEETTLSVGDDVCLLGSVLQAENEDETCYEEDYAVYADEKCSSVEAPDNPFEPSIVVSNAKTIGNCDDLTIDASGSSAGRDPEFSWELISAVGHDDTTDLETLIMEETGSVLEISNEDLVAGAVYEIELTLVNFVEGSSTETIVVTVSADPIPGIETSGATYKEMYISDTATFQVKGSKSTCDGGSSTSAFTYTWAIVDTATEEDITDSVTDLSAAGAIYKIAGSDLATGSNYSVTATVDDGANTNSMEFTLSILSSPLSASISGGTYRQIFSDEELVIDASGSSDPDGGDLTYSWSTSSDYDVSAEAGSSLTVPANTFDVADSGSASYTFTVTISGEGQRTDSASITVKVVNADDDISLPTISITTSVATAESWSSSSKNTLAASITGTAGQKIVATWSLSYDSASDVVGGDLDDVVLSDLTKTFVGSGSYVFNLILASGAMVSGGEYTFELSAYYKEYEDESDLDMYSSVTQITFTINEVPSSGSLSLESSDASYEAYSTTFRFAMSNWYDKDTPLKYRFGYKVGSGSISWLGSYSESSYVEDQYLPEGYITVYGYVKDKYGAETYDSLTLTVTESQQDLAAVTSLLTSAVDDCLDEGNYDCVGSSLAVLSSAVDDTTDCTGISDATCAAYNRETCAEASDKDGKCGPCLDGYTGLSGSANAKCTSEVVADTCSNGVQDEDETDIDCGGSCASCENGDSCSEDTDCKYNNCVSDVCTAPQKTCSTSGGVECAGNGECGYYKKSSGKSVSTCSVTESSCIATCTCDSGYYGSACSMDQEEYDAQLAAVTAVAGTLTTVLSSGDVDIDGDLVESYAGTLASLSGDASSFDADTADEVSSAMAAILESAVSNGVLSESAAASILSGVNNMFGFVVAQALEAESTPTPTASPTPSPTSVATMAPTSDVSTNDPGPIIVPTGPGEGMYSYSYSFSFDLEDWDSMEYQMDRRLVDEHIFRMLVDDRMLVASSTETDLVDMILTTCQSLASGLSAGETPGEQTSDSYQMAYEAQYGSDLCMYLNDVPQTTDQADNGNGMYGVQFDCTSLDSTSIFETCAIAYTTTDSAAEEAISDGVFLATISERDESSTSRRLSSDISFSSNTTVVRLGFEDMAWVEATTTVETTYVCDGQVAGSTQSFTCTNGATTTLDCNGYGGYHEVTCQDEMTVPMCGIYSASTEVDYDSCETLDYTDTNVYCDCGSISSEEYFLAFEEVESATVTGATWTTTSTALLTAAPTVVPTVAATCDEGETLEYVEQTDGTLLAVCVSGAASIFAGVMSMVVVVATGVYLALGF